MCVCVKILLGASSTNLVAIVVHGDQAVHMVDVATSG